jgi:hypothetical protein
MEAFPIDVEPEQLVRWIIAERQSMVPKIEVVTNCLKEARDLPLRKEFRIGDELREDVRWVVTIATLKVAPIHRGEGWSVSVIIEDDLGPQAPEDDGVEEEAGEAEIDVDAFYNEFVLPGRGSASVVAEVESPAAKQRLSRLLAQVLRDHHGKDRDGSRHS